MKAILESHKYFTWYITFTIWMGLIFITEISIILLSQILPFPSVTPPTATATSPISPTLEPTTTLTPTPTNTPTNTPTLTLTPTTQPTDTPTATNIPTATPNLTATWQATATAAAITATWQATATISAQQTATASKIAAAATATQQVIITMTQTAEAMDAQTSASAAQTTTQVTTPTTEIPPIYAPPYSLNTDPKGHLTGPTIFSWSWDGKLNDNHAFEIQMSSGNVISQGIHNAFDKKQYNFRLGSNPNEYLIDLNITDAILGDLPCSSSDIFWTVAVVQCNQWHDQFVKCEEGQQITLIEAPPQPIAVNVCTGTTGGEPTPTPQ